MLQYQKIDSYPEVERKTIQQKFLGISKHLISTDFVGKLINISNVRGHL